MTSTEWLSNPQEKRTELLRGYLQEIKSIKNRTHPMSKTRAEGKLGERRNYLENLVLDIIEWEDDNNTNSE